MTKKDIYALLESKMLSYQDYAAIPVQPLDEPLVPIRSTPALSAIQLDERMLSITGPEVYVRQGVLQRLERAAALLSAQRPDLALQVVYGYRALTIQKRLFQENKRRLQNTYSGEALLEAVHRLIAVPKLAGHPAGAAVDIRLTKNGQPIDCGTEVWAFVPDSFTFSPFISDGAWQNRQLLRQVMMQAGLAPFDGEWWHFSYGDQEWARYYNQPAALYKQLNFAVATDRAILSDKEN